MSDTGYTKLPIDPCPLTDREKVIAENADKIGLLLYSLDRAEESKTISALSYWLRRSLNPWTHEETEPE